MITYCSNIHPGESFEDIFWNLRTHLLAVKKAVSPNEPFPIGLRLSNRASLEIDEKTSAQFHEWCLEHDCFVPTINGFPYGTFHSSLVKEDVYLPNWRYSERAIYTKRLATLLDSWLPEKVTGSISTVPIGFRRHLEQKYYPLVRQNLLSVLEYLDWLKQKSGKEIILSLEPEPGCLLETVEDFLLFFEKMKVPEGLKECLGICLDCCHQAIEFEEPKESLRLLSEAKIKIGKVQLSSALKVEDFNRETLERFCEPNYLHQVVIRGRDGALTHYDDLPVALKDHRGEAGEEWRIHFHLPIFIEKMDHYGTTRYFVEEILPLLDREILLEVETYTWDVLPPELRTETITQSIIREIEWVKAQRDETNRCS